MRKPVEVKICGMTNADDAMAAADLGADYLGFVLYPKSPRCVTVSKLAAIIGKLPKGCRAIGVFVNDARDVVEKVAAQCGLYAVQLHGDEPAGDFESFPIPVWRAEWFRGGAWTPAPGDWGAERYLIDAAAKGVYGGAGIVADWKRSAAFAKEHRSMLAGGLTPENVASAIAAVRPLGVDVISGVESQPGKKDLKKMEAFIRRAKSNE